jgi:hypothetical protein
LGCFFEGTEGRGIKPRPCSFNEKLLQMLHGPGVSQSSDIISNLVGIKNSLPVRTAAKPEPKRNWLVREITNYKSQITNKFKIPN